MDQANEHLENPGVLTEWHSGPSLLVLRTVRSTVIYDGHVKSLVVVVDGALVSYTQAASQDNAR